MKRVRRLFGFTIILQGFIGHFILTTVLQAHLKFQLYLFTLQNFFTDGLQNPAPLLLGQFVDPVGYDAHLGHHLFDQLVLLGLDKTHRLGVTLHVAADGDADRDVFVDPLQHVRWLVVNLLEEGLKVVANVPWKSAFVFWHVNIVLV